MNTPVYTDKILLNAIEEDVGTGDVTTSALIPEGHNSTATLTAKSSFIIAGLTFAEKVFHLADRDIKFRYLKKEGVRVRPGTKIAGIRGNTANMLKAERTALNLLQRLSGIATLTAEYASAVKGCNARIIDTRKTAPGLRIFDKYAVRTGGGANHRFGLYDGILIKDNHISAVGGITRAVNLARLRAHHLLRIEVEVKNLKEVKEAVKAGADIIMLDNMTLGDIKKAVNTVKNRNAHIMIEASGNIGIENVRSVAEAGVDMISVGAITHSAISADISMQFN